MEYNPHAHLTTRELILAVSNLENPTDMELELSERLHCFMEEAMAEEDGYAKGHAAGYAEGMLARVKEAT